VPPGDSTPKRTDKRKTPGEAGVIEDWVKQRFSVETIKSKEGGREEIRKLNRRRLQAGKRIVVGWKKKGSARANFLVEKVGSCGGEGGSV